MEEFILFFIDSAATAIYTLSLHDALPISDFFLAMAFDVDAFRKPSSVRAYLRDWAGRNFGPQYQDRIASIMWRYRSEEHTSELQSPVHLVCRLLLEKKKNLNYYT